MAKSDANSVRFCHKISCSLFTHSHPQSILHFLIKRRKCTASLLCIPIYPLLLPIPLYLIKFLN
uniref:Candidate secreted effector n=1 Tax=Meloidogyne incognita TaxID=6306 RepID=A0A914LJH1_MELIC